jgi:hypothetical protein
MIWAYDFAIARYLVLANPMNKYCRTIHWFRRLLRIVADRYNITSAPPGGFIIKSDHSSGNRVTAHAASTMTGVQSAADRRHADRMC